MIKDLQGKFIRLCVNRPRLFVFGGIAAPTNLATLALAPIDGGVTLFITSAATAVTTVVTLPENISGAQRHKRYTTLDHMDETYHVTEAQFDAYRKFENRIQELRSEFNRAGTKKRKEKLLSEAQLVADFQQDIINGAKVLSKSDKETENIEFKLDRGRKKKTKKLGNN